MTNVVFATEAVAKLYDKRRELTLDEEDWNQRIYLLAQAFARRMPDGTESMDSQTVEQLVHVHEALYDLRMTGVAMTSALTSGVNTALEMAYNALLPGTALTVGLYEDHITEEAFKKVLD